MIENKAIATSFYFLSPWKYLFTCLLCGHVCDHDVCTCQCDSVMCVCTWVPVYLCVCRLEAGVSILPNHSPAHLPSQGFSRSPELIHLAGLAAQGVLEIPSSQLGSRWSLHTCFYMGTIPMYVLMSL